MLKALTMVTYENSLGEDKRMDLKMLSFIKKIYVFLITDIESFS
jgi:hypothetical protein